MADDTPKTRDADPMRTRSEAHPDHARGHQEKTPLQARGPDPRDDVRPEELTEGGGKPAGGPHHDKTPPVLKKQTEKHRSLERGRPVDTGRAGA